MTRQPVKSDTVTVGVETGSNTMLQNGAPADGRFTSTSQPAVFENGKRPRGGGEFGMHCPHCLARAKIRSSDRVTALYRELRFQCTNVQGDEPCGCTFVASLVIERVTVQSARPNPRIKLPVSAPRIRRMPDGHPEPANDDAFLQGEA